MSPATMRPPPRKIKPPPPSDAGCSSSTTSAIWSEIGTAAAGAAIRERRMFIVEERPVRGPATHAIVIGVGRYPHLPGGGGARVRRPEGMRQLTSPPISARRFAEWLISSYVYPAKPLASVALLVSEARPAPFANSRTGASTALEVPTIESLKSALLEWRQRGDAKPDQRLIFFFCGHGIGR